MLSVSNELLKLTIKYFLLLSFSFVALCCFVVIVGFSAIDVFKSIRLVRLRYETLVFFFVICDIVMTLVVLYFILLKSLETFQNYRFTDET